MKDKAIKILEKCPVVAAVKDDNLSAAISSDCGIVFLLNANILTVGDAVSSAHKQGKMIYVHIDLAEGVGKDHAGIKFLKNCGVDGIISTKSSMIRSAKEEGLATVLRVFTLDSKGMASAAETIKNARPDFVEVLPGIAYKAIKNLSCVQIPVIADGLISEKSEVFSALDSGAVAVSTGKTDLWYE